MNIVTLDFETLWSDDYSLSKMTTESYVRDQRFEVHGVAIRWPDGFIEWVTAQNVPAALSEIDYASVLCHHAQFDGLILSHHYGIKPAMWLDTLSMARLLIGNHLSASLESLAKHFNLPAKNVPYDLFKGKHWCEIPADHQRQIAEGACNDVAITWDLYGKLGGSFPLEELALIDQTVRMFTEPTLVGDTHKLAAIWEQEQRNKQTLLVELATTGQDIRSNETFADLLRAEGVEPALKHGKNGDIYAFARTDDFMRDLLEENNPRVVALAAARLSEKSNIEQTRCGRLGWMSTRGAMPVYLNYCGAHTTRWSGGDKLNWQNFPRDSELGGAIAAPHGYMVVVNDASQIECRTLNMVARQTDKIEEFRQGKDPYIGVASEFCGYPVNKIDHPQMRQGGKIVELQSGFGSGGPKIAMTLRKLGIPCTDEEGVAWRDAYRATHPCVVALWRQADEVLKKLNAGMTFDWHCLHIKDQRIYLPNGAPLIYDTLHWYEDDQAQGEWRVKTRHGYAKLYGAKLVENIIQALARLHVSQAWLRIVKQGVRIVSMAHDSFYAVVAESEAKEVLEFMHEEMCRAPDWLPGIPLDSEGYISHTFAKEK